MPSRFKWFIRPLWRSALTLAYSPVTLYLDFPLDLARMRLRHKVEMPLDVFDLGNRPTFSQRGADSTADFAYLFLATSTMFALLRSNQVYLKIVSLQRVG